MFESEADAELGEVAYSLPIKLVPARKIGFGNGAAPQSHRYKNNFEFEFNHRYSRENIDINLGSDGIDAINFSLSRTAPPGSLKGDSWSSFPTQRSLESTNSNVSSKVAQMSSYDSCFGIQSVSSEESMGTDISTPFNNLSYRTTESAFRLIDTAGIATSGSLSSSTQSKRDFALTPGPPKKPNANENKTQSSNHPDHSVSTESFNYLFSTPAKASEVFYTSPNEVEALAEVYRTTVNTTSLSPDMMNIVTQLLKVQSSSSSFREEGGIDSVRFNEALNKITQPEDSDAQFHSDPLAANFIDLGFHSEFRGGSSESNLTAAPWKKNDGGFSEVAGSYPPGLYESKLPDHLEALAYNSRPATLIQQQQQQQQHMFFDGSSHGIAEDGIRSLASIRSDNVRLAADELSRQPLESNLFNQRGGNDNVLYAAARTGQNRGIMEQNNNVYDRSNTMGHSLTLSPTSAFRSQKYTTQKGPNSSLSGSFLSSLSSSRSEEDDERRSITSRLLSRDIDDLNKSFGQKMSISGHMNSSSNSNIIANNFYGVYNQQNTFNIGNNISSNQNLSTDVQNNPHKQQIKQGGSLLPDYSMQMQYSMPPSAPVSRNSSIDPADFHKQNISAHNPNLGQARTGYQQGASSYQDHASYIPLHNTGEVLYKNQNALHPPQPSLTYPRHDKNFEPKIQSKGDRLPVPPATNSTNNNLGSSNNSNGVSNSNCSNTANQTINYSRNNPLRSSSDSIGSHTNSNKTTTVINSNNNRQNPSTGDNHLRNSKDSIRESKDNIGGGSSGGGGGGTSNSREFATIKPPATAAATSGRQEFVESPRSKQAYKDFYKLFKAKEKDSIPAAKAFALDALKSVPENAAWRVHLELADLAKRSNLIQEATKFYGEACRSQPRASMGWLEWSKMEEENGELRKALNILILGLNVCKVNEALLTRVIKLHERLQRFNDVRGMLSVLKYESIDKVWKSVLEGTLFEARTGNIATSRKLFKYLMNHVSWYGPIYYEAFRLEEKEDCDSTALDIIRRGLGELPRYGPLWFGLMRIVERIDSKLERRQWGTGVKPQLSYLKKESTDALKFISKELTWKVHFEKSQAEERAAEIAAQGLYHLSTNGLYRCRDEMLEDSRVSLTKSLLMCPPNLRWKILLVGARLELSIGLAGIPKARQLLGRAFSEVPIKSRSCVYLECSRLEELLGHVDAAREILTRAANEMRSEWKIFLEAILLEMRAGNILKAIQVSQVAVTLHPGTGRLWAIYIQLCHRNEFLSILKSFLDEKRTANISPLSADMTSTEALAIKRALFQGEEHDKDHQTPVKNQQSSLTIEVQQDQHSDRDDLSQKGSGPHSAAAAQMFRKDKIIRRAIAEVPKSGEVWCEKCRCHLNPLNTQQFDLTHAQRSLCFAIQFTPQYGDSFIEYIRLEMICQVLLPRVLEVLGINYHPFLKDYLQEDAESDIFSNLNKSGISGINQPVSSNERPFRRQKIIAIEKHQCDFGDLTASFSAISIDKLNRRCVNADPNYGSAWFHCRVQPYDIPSHILKNAFHILLHEMIDSQKIYCRAILHYILRSLADRVAATSGNLTADAKAAWEELLMDFNISMAQIGYPSSNNSLFLAHGSAASALGTTIIPIVDVDEGNVFTMSDFITGVVEMNRSTFNRHLPEDMRRRNLFGSDQIIS